MRILWLAVGHFFVFLAFVGVFLPVLPTTPFLLLAAACYSRGSEKFEYWLLNHPSFGNSVKDWRQFRVIRPKVKATALIALTFALIFPTHVIKTAWYIQLATVLAMAGVAVFILSCPSRRP